jgi:hypothetical protein
LGQAGVQTIRSQKARFRVVGQVSGDKDFQELASNFRIQDRENNFDAAM